MEKQGSGRDWDVCRDTRRRQLESNGPKDVSEGILGMLRGHWGGGGWDLLWERVGHWEGFGETGGVMRGATERN